MSAELRADVTSYQSDEVLQVVKTKSDPAGLKKNHGQPIRYAVNI